jgi:toxin ParE1/3/4
MSDFKLSRKAQADLKSIARFTEREWGRKQRNHYILQFDQCFHLLGANPQLGQACDEISAGYRYYPQGSHIIFYRQSMDGAIEIIRILHKRMAPGGRLP